LSVPPDGTRHPKWPARFFYTGDGEDQDLLRISSSFNTLHRYISSFGIQDTDPEALQYYQAYCREKALKRFTQYDHSHGAKTGNRLKRKFEGYFLPSTSTDTIYEQWLAVKQTTNGKRVHITDTVITLETLKDSLPPGMIPDYSVKQRFLYAMDPKLKRVVKRHITSDTSFNELVEIADKRNAITHSTELWCQQSTHECSIECSHPAQTQR